MREKVNTFMQEETIQGWWKRLFKVGGRDYSRLVEETIQGW
jgi:hypothetical protein